MSPLLSDVLLKIAEFKPVFAPLIVHCQDGLLPWLVADAVNVTFCPLHIVPAGDALMLTLGVVRGNTVIVTFCEVACEGWAHNALESILTDITSPF
jgi:hypothetical protein